MAYQCSECDIEITTAEYNYSISKFQKPLCRFHQKQYSDSFDSTFKGDNSSNVDCQKYYADNGISKKDSNFVENMIKGRIAETLIEELFLYLGYSVFRYGMENTVPGIMKLLAGVRNDVATNIRRMPDFVVQNPNNGEVFFIEVKFRKSESFKFSDLDKDYPYENCYFVIVSKKHIKCITYQELKNGKEVTPNSHNYLGNRKEFELDKDVIIHFCEFAVKFFDVV
ncbi:MAG: hypothetical protein PWR29_1787 [Methanolobus sp.]|nr:hypothetical protein [Methanolobus sp.]MDN5309893.1 hypothetical protein [Methanolobus sp.]